MFLGVGVLGFGFRGFRGFRIFALLKVALLYSWLPVRRQRMNITSRPQAAARMRGRGGWRGREGRGGRRRRRMGGLMWGGYQPPQGSKREGNKWSVAAEETITCWISLFVLSGN
jgi:hypothetical protein